eukprot:PhF_6_TR3438/c0_g2_i1/m.5008
MQQYFKSYSSRTRNAVSVLSQVLNIEAEGHMHFVPWDIIDELHEYLGCMSYVTFHDGIETDVPAEGLQEQLQYCCALTTQFHLFLFTPSDVVFLDDQFLKGCNNLTWLDTTGFTNVTTIRDYFLFGCPALTSIDT